jgi:hypothetical protein
MRPVGDGNTRHVINPVAASTIASAGFDPQQATQVYD